MAPARLEHAADGTIVGDGVGRRAHAEEGVAAVLPRQEAAAQVIFLDLDVLDRV